MFQQKQLSGFSLIELIITISLMTLLASLAAPSFSELIAKTRLGTQTNLLLTSLYTARSYAISNQVKLLVCRRSPDNTCASHSPRYTNWQDGWIIFQDKNDNRTLDFDEMINLTNISGNVSIIFNQTGSLRFHPDGSARSAGFYLCTKGTDEVRHISLLYTGRARVDDVLTASQQQHCEFD